MLSLHLSVLHSEGICHDPKMPTLEDLGEDFFEENGDMLEEEEAEDLEDIFKELEEQEAKYSYRPGMSVGEHFDERVAEKLAEKKDETFKRRTFAFKDFWNRYTMCNEGSLDWYGVSFNGSVHVFKSCPGNDTVAFKGDCKAEDLLKHFTKAIPDEVIKLNCKVTSVKYSSKGVKVNTQSDKDAIEADFAVVTCSLGVLKANLRSMFDPQLSDAKAAAIRSMGFGTVCKIHLVYDDIWWSEVSEGLSVIYS